MEDEEDREYARWFADAYEQVMAAKEDFGELFQLDFLVGATGSVEETLEDMEEISTTVRSIAEEAENRDDVPEPFVELHRAFTDVATHLSAAIDLTTEAYVAMNEGDDEGMRAKIDDASEEVALTTEAEERLSELLAELR